MLVRCATAYVFVSSFNRPLVCFSGVEIFAMAGAVAPFARYVNDDTSAMRKVELWRKVQALEDAPESCASVLSETAISRVLWTPERRGFLLTLCKADL